MIKLKLNQIDKITGTVSSKDNLVGKVGGATSGGTSIQSVLDSISVSGGLQDTRQTNKLDISGENLQTRRITNSELEEIFKDL